MTLLSTDRPLSVVHDVALVDLDGVAYRGPHPIPHAAASLGQARSGGMRLVFVTNNASREPEQVAAHLSGLDIPAAPDEVMTAAQAAAALLDTMIDQGDAVLVVGGAGLVTAVRAAGFRVVTSAEENPVAVVQGFSPDVGWRELAQAAYAVQRGARHVASNLDRTLPDEHGFAPGNGALVGAVMAATGVTPASAGKPEPTMFELAAQRYGARSPLVIGDRLDTDLAGARSARMPGLLVLTGVNSARDAVLAAAGERPSYLGTDLRALQQPHPAPARASDDWWTCGEAAARVVGDVLETSGPHGLDLARAACGAVWAAADDGRPVDPSSVPEIAVPPDQLEDAEPRTGGASRSGGP